MNLILAYSLFVGALFVVWLVMVIVAYNKNYNEHD